MKLVEVVALAVSVDVLSVLADFKQELMSVVEVALVTKLTEPTK